MSKRPPRLLWRCGFADGYMIQSEIVRGEARVFYATKIDGSWEGPYRRSERPAMIDAEYHAAGRPDDRPIVFGYNFGESS